MSQKKYYSSESSHGSATSHGFANDTIVYVWDSKTSRDNYVNNSDNISCVAIKRRDVTNHADNWSLTFNCGTAPKPFSGEFWGIVENNDIDMPGFIGEIECVDEYNYNGVIDRFYK